MNNKKNTFLTLFLIIIHIISSLCNLPEFFKGSPVTFRNFIVTTSFILLWFLLSFYLGFTLNKKFARSTFIYWGICYMILSGGKILATINPNPSFVLLPILLIEPPLYAFTDFFKSAFNSNISDISMIFSFKVIIVIAFNLLGYWLGSFINKKRKY